jgi:hypothetical protein
MEEDCAGSLGTERTVALRKKMEDEKKEEGRTTTTMMKTVIIFTQDVLSMEYHVCVGFVYPVFGFD